MKKNIILAVAALLFLVGCGVNNDDSDTVSGMKSGRFFDGNISGIEYECASGIKGVTDASGNYACPEKDEAVSFHLGGITATVPAENEITPKMLSDGNESRMLMIVREVLGADRDHNASNGIEVDPDAFGNALADEEDAVHFLQTHFGYTLSQSSSSDDTSSSVGDASSSDAMNESSEAASSVPEMSSSVSETSSAVSETSSALPESSSVQSDSSSSFVSPFPETGNTWSHAAVSSTAASSSVSAMSSSVSSSSPEGAQSSMPFSSEAASSDQLQSSSASSIASSSEAAQSSASAVKRFNEVTNETEPSNWYVRLIAESPALNLSTSGAQLGMLERGDALSSNSLKAMSPFSGTYLDVVFVNPAGLARGSYKTLFYTHDTQRKHSWRFTIKTTDVNSDIIVTWRGLYILKPYTDKYGRIRYDQFLSKTNPLLKKMQVVDEATGETLPVVEGTQMPAFVVNMNGSTTRTFRWELLTQNSNATTPTAAPVRVQKAARSFLKRSAVYRKPVFDLSKPPLFIESE